MLEAVGQKTREKWAYIVGPTRFCADFATFARERLPANQPHSCRFEPWFQSGY